MARQHDYISEVDKFIGKQIYSLRLAMGLSRQQLAREVGVTHQQLQKYESGTNRMSVGRLFLIADVLEVTPESILSNIRQNDSTPLVTQHQRMCLEVSRNFMKLDNPQHQHAVNALVKSLLSNQ